MQRSSTVMEPAAETIFHRSNLTELQLLYWVGQKIRPTAPIFNNIFAFSFSQTLDPVLFSNAFGRVVLASDALRTIIVEEDGIPQQQVVAGIPAELLVVNFAAAENSDKAARQWMSERSQRPLPLTHHLYESALLQIAPDSFVWYLNQHHLITDASSIFLIVEHTLAGYNLLCQNERLPDLILPAFADFVTTRAGYRYTRRYEKAMAFWAERLDEPLVPVSFYGRSDTRQQTAVTRHTIILDPAQTAGFRQSVTTLYPQTTPDQAQFQAFAAILFAYLRHASGQDRAGIITTIHNRPTAVARQTIGVLMELAPLIVPVQPEDTFASLIHRIHEEMKQVLLHYRYGSGDALQSHAFEVMLNLNFRPALSLAGSPITQEIIHPGCGSEKMALHVHYREDSGQYELLFDFNETIFPPELQFHAIQSILQMLAAVTADPQQPLAAHLLPWPQNLEDLNTNQPVAAPAITATPPRTELERELQRIWQEVLDVETIGIHDNFFDLGGESWQAMRLFVRIEAATGYHLPMGTLLSAGTIAEMAEKLAAATEFDNFDSRVEVIQAGSEGKRPFFFIPGAAGNTLVAGRIATHMDPQQPMLACTMPDIQDTPQAYQTIANLADYYIQSIQSVQSHGPYHIVGFSAGGVLAYEVAKQLMAAGEQIDSISIIDMPIQGPAMTRWRRFSQTIGRLRNLDTEAELSQFLTLRDFLYRVDHYLGYRLWQFTLPTLWRRTVRTLRRQPTPASPPAPPALSRQNITEFTSESLEDPRIRHAFDVMDRLVRSYIAEPFSGDVMLIRCPRSNGRTNMRPSSYHQGWEKVARHVETIEIPAPGHLALVHEPYVFTLAAALQQQINQNHHNNEDAQWK